MSRDPEATRRECARMLAFCSEHVLAVGRLKPHPYTVPLA